jgi:uracil DNA glycosylase
LRVVLLCGRAAQRGWKKHVAPVLDRELTVIETWHPSPLAMNQAGKRDQLKAAVERAAAIAGMGRN